MAGEVERRILDVAGRHHGACRRAELLEAGISGSAIDRRIRSGLLVAIGPGLYLLAGAHGPEAIASAALLAVRRGARSHWTAAAAHGFPLPPRRTVHVTLPRSCHRPRVDADVVFHLSRSLRAVEVTVVDGLRTTTPARTLCDLAAVVRPARLRHLCERQLVLSDPTPSELVACHRSLARRGRAGTALLRDVLAELLDDEPFPESELELALQRVLEDGGLSGFRRQHRPPWFDGVRGVVDFAHTEARVVLEADGRRWHSTRQAFDDDRRRDRMALRHGWRVLRFGWQEVTCRPARSSPRSATS